MHGKFKKRKKRDFWERGKKGGLQAAPGRNVLDINKVEGQRKEKGEKGKSFCSGCSRQEPAEKKKAGSSSQGKERLLEADQLYQPERMKRKERRHGPRATRSVNQAKKKKNMASVGRKRVSA